MNDYNVLNENNKQISQPKYVDIELMMHQKTMIQRMIEIEENGLIDIPKFTIKSKNLISGKVKSAQIQTNFAVLADKVGAGKTLEIASLISVRKLITDRDIDYGSSQYCSIKIKTDLTKVKTNLILVPHKLVPQWSETFSKYIKNLNVLTVTKNSDIDLLMKEKIEYSKNLHGQDIKRESEVLRTDEVNKYDVIIIGDTMFRRFYKGYDEIQWNRFIIDEADTIKLPTEMSGMFKFLWLITGTPTGLFYADRTFISKLFRQNSDIGIEKCFVFKNDEKFIEQSIVLPHPKRLKIKCITPSELKIIKDVIPGHVLQMINAGNSDQAIKELNCNVDTNENIIQVITKKFLESIGNKKIELEAEEKKIYPPSAQQEHEKKISLIQNQIKKLEEKIEDIKKKIYEMNDEFCPVCMGEISNPAIVSCCNSCYCFECLAVALGELKTSKCPKCSHYLKSDEINIISSEKKQSEIEVKSNKYELKDKMDVLVDLINNKPDGSFMVFANYAETFNKIRTKLEDIKVPYHILKGQASVVKNFIEDFKNKKVRVLMLNAEFFGAGMNLQMTTDLVMFHRFKPEMEEQIIGRAQRLGRKDPLNVYYLLHDNESNDIEDKFKFEDQGPIHYLDWLENNKTFEKDKLINSDEKTQVDKNNTDENNKVYTIKIMNSDEEEIIVSNKKVIDDDIFVEETLKSKKIVKEDNNIFKKKNFDKKDNYKSDLEYESDSNSDSDSDSNSDSDYRSEFDTKLQVEMEEEDDIDLDDFEELS